MKDCPVAWVNEAVKRHDVDELYRIINKCVNAPGQAKNNQVFWQNALSYFKKQIWSKT